MTFGHYLRRKWLRLCVKIIREKASPEYIARGWAIGMFYGCTIPFGFQLVLSIPTAFILKGSKIGATVGTLITNHFTIFVIYPVQCWVASKILGSDLSYGAISDAMQGVIKEQSYQALMAIGRDLTVAFFFGGFLLAALCVPLTYFGVLKFIQSRRNMQSKKLEQLKNGK